MTPAETVTEFIKSIERKDIDAAVALTSAKISYENVPIDPIAGQDGLRATLQYFLGPADDVEWQMLSQYEVGSVVINERLDRFKIGSGWLELPVAGIFHLDEDGKIELWRDYFDMETYRRQLEDLTTG